MNEIASLIGIAAAADNPAVLAVVLAIVIAVAALVIWKRMRGIEVGAPDDEPDSTLGEFDECATEDDTQPEALAAASVPAPAVVYIAPAKTPGLVVRMHERLADAYRAEDRAEVLRQQSRLVRAGYHPPLSLDDCVDALDAQIFTTIKPDVVIAQEQLQ